MSIAGRAGKLPSDGGPSGPRWHRIEDLLTSDVFGAYRYLPPAVGLLPFLARARGMFGRTLPEQLAEEGVSFDALRWCRIVFWPALAGREPDVLILAGESVRTALVAVLVEAKLHAEQHVIDGLSQVGFYARAHAEGRFEDPELQDGLPRLRHVVLVTKHNEMPSNAIAQAEREIGEAGIANTAVFWVNWTAALDEAEAAWTARRANIAVEPWWQILADLIEDLQARGIGGTAARQGFPLPLLPAFASDPERALRVVRIPIPRQIRRTLTFGGAALPCGLDDIDDLMRRWRKP